jgi:phthiodiolone/phenolphthiodiolone dimycocerosates ketoreductase
MKVGITLPALQSIDFSEAMLALAESIGIDSVWFSDHLLGITHPDLWKEFGASALISDPDAWLDPFCIAAVLGRRTALSIGTSVTDSVRRAAPDLVRTLLTLNDSCTGGFIMGIGSGEAESLLPFGYDFSRPTDRFEQTLLTMRALLDTGRMPGGGVGRSGLALQARRNRPQIWAAGIGPRALDLVGRYADGWFSMGIQPSQYPEKRDRVRRAAAAAGRPAPISAISPIILLCDSREHGAQTLAQQPLIKLILLFEPATLWRRHGLEHPSGPNCRGYPDTIPHAIAPEHLREIAQRIPLAMFEEAVMLGNARDVAARLQPYADAGLDHVVLADLTGFSFSAAETARLLTTELAALKQLLTNM